MSHKTCTFCGTEVPDSHNGFSTMRLAVEVHRGGKKLVMASDGPHYFCTISCLNTFLILLAGDELDND